MSKLHDLAELGQSVWIDTIRRAMITSGELQELIDLGVRGLTSNPSIFEKAIAGSADYDNQLRDLADEGLEAEAIYQALAVRDIQDAADLFRPTFDGANGRDGFVSLEVGPGLAADTEATLAEARRLFAAVDRPNVMIKVPATPAGYPAVQQLTGEGRNINITLMFSLAQYDAVAEAYLSGLEALAERGGDLARVASVASFFLSRIDSAVDEQLEANGSAEALALRGRTAIANAKLAYQHFQRAFSGPRWQALAERGARPQRVLWASTSTKDPDYPDTMYVDELIGPHTVNTLPPSTLHAFLDHGRVAETVTTGLDEAERVLAQLPEQGVDLDAVCNQVLEEGIEKFDKPYRALMGAIGAKVSQLRAGAGFLDADLGSYEETAAEAAAGLEDNRILARIWRHDHTVWSQAPAEISNRLGWLHLPEKMDERLGRIAALADSLRSDGIRRAVLLGMGGSSLAPDVFSHVFGPVHDGLRLEVLDTTAPAAILAQVERLDAARTLFIVSTKSGTTVETLSAFKYFYNQVAQALGEGAAGGHFVAITDPGSQLVELAAEYDFRATLLNDPDLGGRYSALSYFGLAPAGLIGVDLERLLERAETMAHNNQSCNAPQAGDNAGQRLGAILGALAGAGRDKLTLVASDALANFGDWVEQLIAESTGKAGKGILPVVGEPLGAPAVYGQDRLFVHLRLADDDRYDRPLAALAGAGHPLLTLHLNDRYDLGGQFFLWEMATAVAGHLLGIQPFNQPNVEAAKERARELVAAYQKEGHLPAGESAEPSAGALAAFLKQARPGDYIALQAYLAPTAEKDAALARLRGRLRDRTKLATTLGYGPRFLHSTGQLHKGDGGNGLFIQLTADHPADAPIPDRAGENGSALSFGVLLDAQALGDAQALRAAGRRVVRFHLGGDPLAELQRLAA